MSVAFLDLKERLTSWFHRKDREINTGGKDIDTGGGDILVGAGSVDGVDLTSHVADADAHHNESHTHTHASTTGQTVDDHHDESHNVASHSDTSATGSELNTLTDGSDASALHDHDGRYFQESEFSDNPGASSKPLESDSSGMLELEGLGVGIAPVSTIILGGGAILATNDLKAGSGIVSGSTAVGAVIGTYVLRELASHGTPTSGYGVLYVKLDGKLYFKNDTGTETALT